MKAIPITKGQKYTVYTYKAPGNHSRTEVIIQSTLDSPEPHGTIHGKHRIGTYTLADDDETHCHLDIDLNGTIILPGWDTPALPAPEECRATPECISMVLAKNLNPHFERFELLATCPEPSDTPATETPYDTQNQ